MVFSNPQVVQRINADFVPVALKAAPVNNPPAGIEGELYAEIGRSKPAPQGICVINSAGKVLSWALSFDDDDRINEFLDHVARQFAANPDSDKPVAAQRYMKFPSQRLVDVADNGKIVSFPNHHSENDRCPGQSPASKNLLVGRVVGRALDQHGNVLADTRRQEHYLEARFELSADVQRRFAMLAEESAGKSFRIPNELSTTLVSQAFLGQLDVNPWGGVPGSQNDRGHWEFSGQRIPSENAKSSRIRVDGTSQAEGSQSGGDRRGNDGRVWEHNVSLAWEGYVDFDGDRITQLILVAHGKERLRWGNAWFPFGAEPDSAHLMAGHPIDLNCGVRYGLFAKAGL